jgi:serine/threonine-protein kinase
MVTLAIQPWGEVYLDGKMAGVSPPLTKLKVPLGVHVIEVKNANFPVHKESVDIKADKNVSIRHKFAN